MNVLTHPTRYHCYGLLLVIVRKLVVTHKKTHEI